MAAFLRNFFRLIHNSRKMGIYVTACKTNKNNVITWKVTAFIEYQYKMMPLCCNYFFECEQQNTLLLIYRIYLDATKTFLITQT